MHRSLPKFALALALPAGAVFAQAPAAAPAPAPATPVGETQRSILPTTLQMPELKDIKLPLPRTVRAANALLGMTQQRLALVIGNGKVDSGVALASAARDTQAVAAALRAGGFVVMVREDLSADDLRANLKEFQSRLQPGGVGLLYFTGLAAQVEGRNYVLPRGLQLQGAAATPALLLAAAVPLQEIVDAVQGTAESHRYLVVDAGAAHPALAGLGATGLAAQKLPAGMLGLFSMAPGTTLPPVEPASLPVPAPTDPRLLAASPFGRELVRSLVTPRVSGPEVMRLTRGAVLDVSAGKQAPVIVGEASHKDELAEPNLLDTLFPRSPEDMAREALKKAVQGSPGGGDVPVSQINAAPPSAALEKEDGPGNTQRNNDTPRSNIADSSLGNAASSVAGTAAGAVGTVVAAATVVAVGTGLVQTSATAGAGAVAAVATGTVGLVTSVASAALGGNSGGAPAGDATANKLMKPTAVSAPAAELPPVAAPVAAPAVVPVAPAAAPVVAAPLPPATPRVAVPQSFATEAAPVASLVAPATLARQALGQAASPRDSLQDTRTQRQQNGGERPAWVPRVNAYGYAEGDTFMYRVLDTWKEQELGSLVQTVDEVLDGGDLLANGQQTQMDPQGRIKSTHNLDGSTSQFQPYQDLWWSNPKRGESRSVKFSEFFQRADRSRGETEWKGSLSVGRLRKIQLPAGEFEVLPIEGSGWFYEKTVNGALASGQWSRTVWYAPKLGHPVAIDIEDANALGKLLRRERIELTHAQTARSAAQ